MTKKTWLIFGIICVALIGGLIYLSHHNKIDVSGIDATKTQGPLAINGNIGDHTFGNMNSKVILIEYGDFQCPGCGSAYPVIKQVTEKYKDKIGYIFRNFPLTTIHPNALAGASAAELAGLNGKYWEMHDALYESQDSWSSLGGTDRTAFFVSLLTKIGLNGETLQTHLSDTNIQQKISFDQALGGKVGVTGTPTLFLNGKRVSDLKFKGNAIDTTNSADSQYVWSDANAFGNLVIDPVLKDNGISLPQ